MTQNTADRLYLLLVDRLRVIGGTRHAAEDIAAEIDGLTAERDEAREQIAALEASNAEQAQMMADGFADAKEQSARLAEARAEVERLRPAAEAWETLEAFRSAENFGTLDDERAARKIHADARDAARARAAKERKP